MWESRFRRLSTCGSALLLLAYALGQNPVAPKQEAQPQQSSPAESVEKPVTTIHAESRLVIVDVVVTGRHGQPALGLTKSDFNLLEDGKPQPVVFFEAHFPPAAKESQQVSLPPHQYTNFSPRMPSSINIILFDVLNTPLLDQPYAREQMLQFLKTLPSGQLVSLFELGARLRMIAGFTTTSEELVAAARKVVPHASELLDTQEERQQSANQLGLLREGSRNQDFFDAMEEFMAETWAARDENRAQLTIQALSALGHAVSGFRGRKNIMWLSEDFPVYFGPEMTPEVLHADPNSRSYAEIMHDMAAKLASSQVSIYPIDLRGLTPAAPNASASGRATGSDPIQAIEKLHLEMDNLAKETGGRAYYNTNDLKLAMQRSLDNGSHYYTLAYVPQAKVWDSRYHHIKIQLARGGLEAEYRKGFFAAPEQQIPEDQALADLRSAVQPAAPQSTMLLLKAQVLPPDPEHAKVRIDCIIDGSGLAFSEGPGDHKKATLRFLTIAWDKNLKAAVELSHTVELSLSPEKYEHAIHNGIAAHQEFKLPSGTFRVRLGVMDDGSRKIGTLEMPVEINEALKQVPAQ